MDSQFFKRFLADDTARLGGKSGRFLAIGAFGKHPGWDDHIKDLGLETETLNMAEQVLYIQGVGGQIDSGAWEKLDAAHKLEAFNHLFIWRRSSQFLMGRLWSSSDGKGRTRYPMVICAHCAGFPLSWGLEKLLPKLDEIEHACKATTKADEVKATLDRTRTDLRAALTNSGTSGEYAHASSDALRDFVAAPSFGPGEQGWQRILYQLDHQAGSYGIGKLNPKADILGLRPQQIRVPTGASTPEDALLLWTRFLIGRIDNQAPMLLAVSPGKSWLDIILGEPATDEFFCLRATPAALPLATEVPYELDEKFKAQARETLAAFQNGKLVPSSLDSSSKDSSSESSTWGSVTARFFKGKGAKLW